MGCDFFWRGEIPEVDMQERAVRFLAPHFANPAVLAPQPRLRLPMLISEGHGRGERFESAYPFDFFGLVPNRDAPKEWDAWERGQLVFDRSANGQLVTVVPAVDPHETYAFRVLQRGFDRLLAGEDELALVLSLLRLRYCPALRAFDDYGCVRAVGEDIREWRLSSALRSEARSLEACKALFFRTARERRRQPRRRGVLLVAEVAATSVARLGLPPRVARLLSERGVTSVGELVRITAEQLMQLDGFGPKALVAVRDALSRMDLALPTTTQD